jgi:hypothetical protein
VPHLQSVLENMARLQPRTGVALLPWAFAGLPRGNTVVLATSDVAPEMERTIGQLDDGGFHTFLLLALDSSHSGLRRPGTISITAGCDLAARLEGRA